MDANNGHGAVLDFLTLHVPYIVFLACLCMNNMVVSALIVDILMTPEQLIHIYGSQNMFFSIRGHNWNTFNLAFDL